MPEPENDFAVPWEFLLIYLFPISAFATGALVALFLSAVFLAFSWAFDFPLSAPGELLTGSARDSINMALLVGYLFGGLRLGGAGIQQDLGSVGVEDRSALGQLPRKVVRMARYAAPVGIIIGILVISGLAERQGYAMTAPWTSIHESSFYLWLLLLFFGVLARTMMFTIEGSRFAADVTTQQIEIDLLDLEPLNAFGRIGLRFAALWIVGVTISAPLLLGRRLELMGLVGALCLVGTLSFVALLLPVLGVHRRIRATKRAELAHVAAAISGDEAAVAETRIAERRDEPSLADLIAYRGLIESVREWPYDAPTLFRFSLYLFIPLASWIAAAFVERMVDALFR